MIWTGIVNDRIIGPFKVDDGVKMNSANYTASLNANFFTWYRAQPRGFIPNACLCMIMHLRILPNLQEHIWQVKVSRKQK